MTPALVMDLDGTLCDGSAYLHLGDHEYHWAATGVAPANPEMVGVIEMAVADGWGVLLMSGRSDRWLERSRKWATKLGIHHDAAYFRASGDWRPNPVVKKELLKRARRDGWDPRVAYDDDPRNIAMFRECGLEAVKVGQFDRRLA